VFMKIRTYMAAAVFLAFFVFSTAASARYDDDDDGLGWAWPNLSDACKKDERCKTFYNRSGQIFDILYYISEKYVDTLDFEKVMDDFMHGGFKRVFKALDPHSFYLNPEEAKKIYSDSPPVFVVGIYFRKEDDRVVIMEVVEGTAAEEAGLEDGDFILALDGKSTKQMTLEQVSDALDGKSGTVLEMRIFRPWLNKELVLTIIRKSVVVRAVTAEVMKDIYYVRVRSFDEMGISETINLAFLGMPEWTRGIILDIRNNPGGYKNEAEKAASLFLDEGKLIASEVDRKGKTEIIAGGARPKEWETVKNLPMVVLVDERSASASEMVAAALQDHHRAVIIGMPTFGKAIVQTRSNIFTEIFALGGGSFYLTTARLYRPNGRSLQGKGVLPDFIIPKRDGEDLEKYLAELRKNRMTESSLDSHIKGEDEGTWLEAERDKINLLQKDRQLQFAIEALKAMFSRGN